MSAGVQTIEETDFIDRVESLVQLYLDAGRDDLAVETLTTARKADPRSEYLHNKIAFIYFCLGQYAEAVKTFEDMVRSGGTHTAVTQNNLGSALYGLGRYEEARKAFQASLEMDPNVAGPRRALAHLLHDKFNSSDEAAALLKKGIERNPCCTGYYESLSYILCGLGWYQDAVDLLQSMERNGAPDSAIAQNNLGHVLCELGRHSEAEDAFHRSIVLGSASLSFYCPLVGLAKLLAPAELGEGREPMRAIAFLKGAFDKVHKKEEGALIGIWKVLCQATDKTNLPSAERILYQWSNPTLEMG